MPQVKQRNDWQQITIIVVIIEIVFLLEKRSYSIGGARVFHADIVWHRVTHAAKLDGCQRCRMSSRASVVSDIDAEADKRLARQLQKRRQK